MIICYLACDDSMLELLAAHVTLLLYALAISLCFSLACCAPFTAFLLIRLKPQTTVYLLLALQALQRPSLLSLYG